MSSHSLARQPTLSRTSSSFLLGIVATLPEAQVGILCIGWTSLTSAATPCNRGDCSSPLQVRNLLVKAAAQYPEIAEMLLEAAGAGHKHGHRPEVGHQSQQLHLHAAPSAASSRSTGSIHLVQDDTCVFKAHLKKATLAAVLLARVKQGCLPAG